MEIRVNEFYENEKSYHVSFSGDETFSILKNISDSDKEQTHVFISRDGETIKTEPCFIVRLTYNSATFHKSRIRLRV